MEVGNGQETTSKNKGFIDQIALDSKSSVERCAGLPAKARQAGSIPARGTNPRMLYAFGDFFIFTTMYYVYAISSLVKNYIYVGLTDNLERRIQQHNDGRERTTKPYLPYILIYPETLNNRHEARLREKYWKSGTGKRQLQVQSPDRNVGALFFSG